MWKTTWRVVLIGSLLLLPEGALLRPQDKNTHPDKPQPARAAPEQSGASPQQSEALARIRIDSNLVILRVTVKDARGNLVPDMLREEFRIFDDGIEQKTAVFTAEAFPLSLVILIDNDLKAKDTTMMGNSLRAAAGGVSSSDEAFVCRFDQFFYPGPGFILNGDELMAELKRARIDTRPSEAGPVPFVTGPSWHTRGVGEPTVAAPTHAGGKATKTLDDAIFASAEILHDRGTGRRKVILVITDGANGEKFNHHSYDDVRQALLRDNISVYSVAIGNSLLKSKYARLTRYADDSGGDVYFASRSRTMERFYSQITEQARHEYTLAYVPAGNDRRSSYHKIEVLVDRPGLTVRTRQGYYTGPPTPAVKP
ncbi:MAG TPA: VWA domain-containing protein [Candidatus Saccharimonadales bacterium]|nr:VWA domain-containing protein [Candidatus Saccharimonadales bacterium]